MSNDQPDLVLDADVLMNLLATDRLADVLAAHSSRGIVCPRIHAEALYLNPRAVGAPRDAIDLAPHIASGTLITTALDAAEAATYIELAAEVDDGEAQVLAVGLHRGLVVATDDRRARRVASRLAIGLLGTPDLILGWARAADTSMDEVALAVVDIEVRARYRPKAADPNRADWDRLKDG